MKQISNSLRDHNTFKLGIFGINCDSGVAVTKVKERWNNSWDNNLAISLLAEEAGLDYILSASRWLGFGGETNFHANTLDVIAWAAALLASTRNIAIVATVHTSLHNPVIFAKQMATMDHIGRGRLGINVVCGWNKPEFDAVGNALLAHADRYEQAQEWIDILRKLWQGGDPFDYQGKYFKLKQVYTQPVPLQVDIPFFNGANSERGKDFAVRNVDNLFMLPISLEQLQQDIEAAKAMEARAGRKTPLNYTSFTPIICRPTRKEAEDYLHYYAQENADWQAVDNIISTLVGNTRLFPEDVWRRFRFQFAAGHGGYPLVGAPDDIADSIEQLYRIGISGTALTFVNYLEEFPYFRDEVLPRLVKRGLRKNTSMQ